ncbi:MAG: PDZ domain-containing protein [Acidobacteriota bacterium]
MKTLGDVSGRVLLSALMVAGSVTAATACEKTKRAKARTLTLSGDHAGQVLLTGGDGGYQYFTSDDDGGVKVVVKGDQSDGNWVVVHGGDDDEHQIRIDSNKHIRVVSDPDPDRSWLGVLLNSEDDGFLISAVMKDSPAARAGLKSGDLIVEVSGRAVGDELGGLLEGTSPGDRVTLTVERDGREQELVARLGSHPGTVEFEMEGDGDHGLSVAGGLFGSLPHLEELKELRHLPPMAFSWNSQGEDSPFFGTTWNNRRPRLGVVLESVSGQLASYFGVEGERNALLVKEVIEDTPAARAGLQAGDVLLSFEGDELEGVNRLRELLSDFEGGETVELEILRRGRTRTLRAELEEPKPSNDQGFNFGGYQNLFDEEAQERVREAFEHSRRAFEQSGGYESVQDRVREALERAEQAMQPRSRVVPLSRDRNAQTLRESLRKREEAGRTF